MKYILLIFLMLISQPIMLSEQRLTVELGNPIKDDVKAVVEAPMKAVPYSDTWDEHSCLSHAMYHEARSKREGVIGMALVGLVILHRVNDNSGSFPNTICGVVKQPKMFSFFFDGKSDRPLEYNRYVLAQSIADDLLIGKYNYLLPKDVLFFKQCSFFSEFFNKLDMYKRHVSHCYYRKG